MISVLVPVFNSQNYLRNCLNSILSQSFKDFELIILDDGSIDQSWNIILEYAKKDSRIIPLRKENEKSISKTRNFLLDQIKGEYFVFIDSDDIIEKDFLKILYETAHKSKSDIVACGFKIFHTPPLVRKGYGTRVVKSSKALEMMMFSGKFYALWNKLIKTEALKDARFDESLNYGEDLLFFFNSLKEDIKFTFIDNQLYFYRIRPNSLSNSGFGDNKKDFLKKIIELSNDDKYVEIHDIIKIWIYSTARYYRFETRHAKKENKEYRQYLKSLIKEYKPYYKNKGGHLTFKILVSFLSMF